MICLLSPKGGEGRGEGIALRGPERRARRRTSAKRRADLQRDDWRETSRRVTLGHMNERLELLKRAVQIGVGATLVMDVWGWILRQLGVKTLNFAFLGRWVGHLAEGQVAHRSIAEAAPVRGELLIGWAAHYSIGITFAAVLLATFGLEWARTPTLFPALIVGVVTVVAPLFILQPALGAGIASMNTPTPVLNSLRSL